MSILILYNYSNDIISYLKINFSFFNFIIFIIFMLILVIYLFVIKCRYNSLEYNFYSNYLQYKDKFINKKERNIKYKYIVKISFSQNLLEKICGIGTLKIFINDSICLRDGNIINNLYEIKIPCVRDISENYHIINQIIDDNNKQ